MSAKKFKDDIPVEYRTEVTWIVLRGNCRVVFEVPLPLSPDGVQRLAQVVQKVKAALRHYLAEEKRPDD